MVVFAFVKKNVQQSAALLVPVAKVVRTQILANAFDQGARHANTVSDIAHLFIYRSSDKQSYVRGEVT